MSNLILVLGATASGKTRLGVELAQLLQGEIISADSRQVYRGLDIGSGKDLDEYGDTPYHLIDIIEPGEEYSVYQFQRDFVQAFQTIEQHSKLPILVGGTGLYIDAVLDGYRFVQVEENQALRAQLAVLETAELQQYLLKLKPEQHNTTDLVDRKRMVRAIEITVAEQAGTGKAQELPKFTPTIFAICWPREVLRQRISSRLSERLEQGLVAEVEGLIKQGVSQEVMEYLGLEYRFVSRYVLEQLNFNDMQQKLNSAIHQYAKRQETWLRRLEKKGHTIHWLDGEQCPLSQALTVLRQQNDNSPQ